MASDSAHSAPVTPAVVANSARAEYIAQLEREAKLYPQIPDVDVRYSNLSYTLQLPKSAVNYEIETVPGATLATALALPRAVAGLVKRVAGAADTSTQPFKVLDGVSGVLRPGTVTLLLSPPGHGKTSFLRALAGRLPHEKLAGSLEYSGVPADRLLASGVHLRLLANYSDQLDIHLPFQTVREVASFSYENGTVDPSLLREADPSGELEREAANRVERVLKLLSLQNCADTLVGNDLLRGISGGEKKRVTVSEALVTNARLLCLDEISTGLDSSVTYDIVASIAAWARAMRGTVVISLLQPTPEVYSLFDEVILMREGATVYHGPREALPGYLSSLGYVPPASDGSDSGGDGDMADWLTEMVTSPAKVALQGALKATGAAPASGSEGTPRPLGAAHPSSSTGSLPSLGVSTNDLAALGAAGGKAVASLVAGIPTSTVALAAAWAASPQFAAQMAPRSPEKPGPSLALESAYAKQQYGRPYPRHPLTHFRALLARQVNITMRNKLFVISRLMSAIIISLILGTVWWRLSPEQGLAKFGLLLFCALQIAFANFSEVPFAVENKYQAYKGISSGQFPPLAYSLAGSLIHLPIAMAETAIFAIVLYFMTGLVEEASRWFYFWGLLTLTNCAMSAMFRNFAFGLKDLEAAQTAPGPLISIQVIFAGFLITYGKMGWLKFMYWLSVFSWALKGLALNEFKAGLYDTPVPDAASLQAYLTANPIVSGGPDVNALCAAGAITCTRRGDVFLSQLDLTTDTLWQWASLGFIAGFAVVMNLLGGFIMARVRIERNVGTSRSRGGDAAEAVAGGDAASVALSTPAASPGTSSAPASTVTVPVDLEAAGGALNVTNPMPVRSGSPLKPSPSNAGFTLAPAPAPSAASVLPFEPMTVTWTDITYEVLLPKQLGGGRKTLLRGVSGYARPGRILALMGASGAGKTTLLDVIAGRKNSGTMGGAITLNGHPKERKSFARLTAYCEQSDVHSTLCTVRESLEFSAALRLPASTPAAVRHAFVGEILAMLELGGIATRKVGEAGAADGLSPGQRKLLTIAVELVSNAPIIFLDEPTSGLDSRAASMVMRAIRNIADSGRTVVTTIHQPSGELFLQMDDLLLLQKGGWPAYFGPIGAGGRVMVSYMQTLPGVTPCPRRMNPASWMLDQLSGSDSSGGASAQEAPAASDEAPSSGHGHPTMDHLGSPLPDTPAPTASDSPTADATAPNTKGIAGPLLQERLLASKAWERASAELTALATPAPGSAPYRFSSVYATSAPRQLVVLLGRAWTTYMRNVSYNFTRWTALLGLMTLFGTIWYKLEADNVAGVQSIVSVIFMTSLFAAMLNMNTCLPVMIKERAVFYRERFSRMYGPEVYALTYFLIELPWVAWIVMTIVPIVYFMVGFRASADAYFFYVLTVYILCVLMTSLGQLAAACIATADVAQAVVGFVIPLLFVFGGLFIPGPALPLGWRWANTISPIKWAITALVPPQFKTDASVSIMVFDGISSFAPADRFEWLQSNYGLRYDQRWEALGWLSLYIAIFQAGHFLALRFISHVTR